LSSLADDDLHWHRQWRSPRIDLQLEVAGPQKKEFPMQTRTCNSAIWILIGLAVLLLMFHGRIGLLAVVLPISLLLACAAAWSGNRASDLTRGPEKR
jgi:hypothetical protein